MKKVYVLITMMLGIAANMVSAQTPPDFTFTDTDGKTHNLYTELSKGKTVMLDFFLTTCGGCKKEAERLEVFYQMWGGGNADVLLWGINTAGEDDATINAFRKKYGLTFPSSGKTTISKDYISIYQKGPTMPSDPGTPSFSVISPNKTILWDIEGARFDTSVHPIPEVTSKFALGHNEALEKAGAKGVKLTALDFTFTDTESKIHNLFQELNSGKTVILISNPIHHPEMYADAYEYNIDYYNDEYNRLKNSKVSFWYVDGFTDNATLKSTMSKGGVTYPHGGIDGGGDKATSIWDSKFFNDTYSQMACICPDKTVTLQYSSSFDIETQVKKCGGYNAVGNEISLSDNILIYPNPVNNNRFHLVFSEQGHSDYTVDIMNYTGQVVFHKVLHGSADNELSLDGFSEGIYMVKVQNENNVFVKKIVKQ